MTEQINGTIHIRITEISTGNKKPKIKNGAAKNKTSKIAILISNMNEKFFLNKITEWRKNATIAGTIQSILKFLTMPVEIKDFKHNTKISK